MAWTAASTSSSTSSSALLRLLLLLLLLASPGLSSEAAPRGYRFSNSKSFVQLPSHAVCGEKFALSFQFLARRERYTLLLLRFSDAFNTPSLALLGDARGVNLTLGRPGQPFLRAAMADLKSNFHSLVLQLTDGRLQLTLDGKTESMALPRALVKLGEEDSAELYLGTPFDSHKLLPTFQGVVRNVIGKKRCDCVEKEHLPLQAVRAIDASRPEACRQRNPCTERCLCVSADQAPACRCDLLAMCEKVKDPEPQVAALSFDFGRFGSYLFSGTFHVLGKGNLTWLPSGKSRGALRIENKAFLDLGPRYDCYGDLERCPNGLTIDFWLRPSPAAIAEGFTVLSSRSFDVFSDPGGRLRVFFKTRASTWHSRSAMTLKAAVWQRLDLAWSAQQGLVVRIDGNVVERVAKALPIATKFSEDARLLVGASDEIENRGRGGFEIDELRFWQLPPRNDSAERRIEPEGKVYDMEVARFSRLADWPDSQVSGSPGSVDGPDGLPALELSSAARQYLDIGSEVVCPKDVEVNCPRGFTVRLWFLPVALQGSKYPLLFSNLIEVHINDRQLVVFVNGRGKTWSGLLSGPVLSRWSLLEVSWSPSAGLEVFVNSDRVLRTASPRLRTAPVYGEMRLYVGSEVDGRLVDKSHTLVRVSRLEAWPASLRLLRRLGKTSKRFDRLRLSRANERPQSEPAYQSQNPASGGGREERKIDHLRFNGNYVRYDLSQLVYNTNNDESLRIQFSTDQPNGLLWYAVDGDESTYLYLKDGKLVYEYRYKKKTGSQSHTLSETMSITPSGYSLYDGRHHTVDVARFGKRLSLVIDKNRYNDQMQQDAHGEVRILVRNYAYLGGIEDPRRMNTQNFRGRVYDVLLRGDRNANLNLVQGINRYPNVNTGGQEVIVVRRPPPQPTQPYKPPPRKPETVVIETQPVVVERDDFSNIISSVPVPYTFNTPDGLIRLPTWQFPRYKSMEIEFLTYEPRGVLFYAGPGRDGHKDFVCIEIFDGIPYFVYNHGGERFHVALSQNRVDDGRPHIVAFSISKIGSLTAKFDGRSVRLPGMTKPHQKFFRSYTYIGSLDSFSPENTRAPWDVWSREGFVGCVNYIKLNDGQGFADARKFQNQHSTASKKIGSCDMPKEVFCQARRHGSPKCGGSGQCQPRWYRWRMSQNFYCDCSYTTKTKTPTAVKEGALEVRGYACSDDAPIVKYDGAMRTIVSFLGAAEYTTHTDDVSIRFKTSRSNAGIFTTTNLAGPRNYLDVYLDNGRVMMQTNVFDSEQRRGASKTYIIGDGMYSDDRWHTIYIRRRANHIKFWVDNERPKQELFPPTAADDYRLAIKHIYLGNFNNTRPNFIGSLSNFYWNAYDFLHNPEQENVYIVKTTGLKPTIPPVPIEPPPIRPENPVTVRRGDVYIIVRPTLDIDFETLNDYTLRLLFRTTDPGGLLFYLQGQSDIFIAAELQGGRLNYSYNLGDGIIKTPLTFTSNLDDGRWHQIFVHLSSSGQHSVWVDSQKMNLRDIFRKLRQRFVLYLAGVPSYMWARLPNVLQTRHSRKGFVGCLSAVVFNTGTDLLSGGQADFQPADGVTVGRCVDRKVCTPNYCLNGGQCRTDGFDRLVCDCDRTGYRGERCGERIPPPQCPPNFCQNSGTCYMIGNRPMCECRSTGYTGVRCETKEQCPPNYCRNGGICSVQPGKNYVCDCSFTGWSGRFCDSGSPGIKIGYPKPGVSISVDRPGYVVYPVNPPQSFTKDTATIGFQTWTGQGTIVTFVGPDGKHWDLLMRDGQLFIRLSNGRKYPINVGRLNDGRYHIVNMERDKDFIRILVDGSEVNRGRYIDIVGPNGDLTYNKIVVGADRNGRDGYVGAIGGFYWNGKYPLDSVPIENQRGTVEIVVTPIPDLPRPKPKPKCGAEFCSNGGRCYEGVQGLACNCTNTAFSGPRCNTPRYGFWSRTGRRSGYLIYNLPPIKKSQVNVELGFQTWQENGPILRIVGDNDMYWQLNLGNGFLYVDDNGEIRKFNVRGNQRLNDGNLHWVNLRFRNNNVELFLDGQWVTAFALSHSLTPMRHKRIIMGANTAVTNFFNGIIGGVVWDGKRLFTGQGGPEVGVSVQGDVAIVRIPQNLPRPVPTTPSPPKPVARIIPNTGAHGGIVWRPVVMKKIDGAGPHILVPGPGGNTLRGGGYGTGAIVMAGVGPVVAGASLFTGLGTVNPLAAGLVLAALLFGSALLWAFWRCKPGWCPCCASGGAGGASGLGAGYTRIPALLAKPFSSLLAGGGKTGAAGAAGGRVNIVKIDTADVGGAGGAAMASGGAASAANGGLTATAREMHTLNIGGAGHGDNISVKSVPVGVSNTSRFEYFRSDTASDAFGHSAGFRGGGGGGGLRVDGRDDRFGTMGSTYHMEAMGVGDGAAHHNLTTMETTTVTSAAANVMGNNVFLNEEIKVDCCQITANSKYVVTGSSTGPPQVWDMKTGDLIKLMDGQEAGCTDLHLACGDSVLVAQVLDDMAGTESMIGGDSGARRHRRLQLWDFATGGAMEMPMDIMCTATCVTWAGEHVVIARMDAVGPSILVWDLFANEAAREIRYHHPAGMSPDAGVTYLAVTPDDQLVVGGYTHSIDGQANYMVFDLDGPGSAHQPIHPIFMVFDANLECTELLATPHEAITGTRKGELLVWDLPTAKVLRSLTITAQLERAGTHTLTPHNGEIRALSLSRDGQYLVTGSTDRMVKVWTMVDEKMVLSLDGHTDDILSVCISDDNEVVVSGSWDGSIRVWRMRDGSQMCWFTSNIEVFNVKVAHDKSAIVALGERGGHRKLIMLQIIRNRTRRTRPRIASAR